jgi:ribosomal protein S6
MLTYSKRSYEIILIYSCDLESMDLKLAALKYFRYIYQLGGININMRSLGKNNLSYPIKNKKVGYFFKITSVYTLKKLN